MNWRSFARAIRRPGSGRYSQEAGAAMFGGLRIRLTLWYCGVLGAALVLFGITLYIGTQFFLLHPVEADATGHAQRTTDEWLMGDVGHACLMNQFGPPPGVDQGFQMTEFVVCFDQNGKLLFSENSAHLPSTFLTNTLAKSVLQTGYSDHNTIDAGGTTGQIYCYAQLVPNPTGNGYVGVVMVGEVIKMQESTLSLLLMLLLSIGGVALIGAGLGGLFLANRALAPARLAWANQQRFIADASHELRTPLTLLRADAEVLLRGRKRLDPEDVALLEDIVAEAVHMARISNSLLTLARLDNNNASHREHEVVKLAELAQEGAQRVQAMAEQHTISIQLENTNDLYTIGDPMLLEQAVLILLDNAIKYNHAGGSVTLRTAKSDKQAIVEVRDTGVGITAEHLAHMGERFYRVDKARSREAGGTGLGLSIARGIAATHGGNLSLASVPGQGTTVTLTLPLAYETPSNDKEEEVGSMSSLPEQKV